MQRNPSSFLELRDDPRFDIRNLPDAKMDSNRELSATASSYLRSVCLFFEVPASFPRSAQSICCSGLARRGSAVRIFADAVLDAIYVSALCMDGYFSEVLPLTPRTISSQEPSYTPTCSVCTYKTFRPGGTHQPDASCRYLYIYPDNLFLPFYPKLLPGWLTGYSERLYTALQDPAAENGRVFPHRTLAFSCYCEFPCK